MKGYLKKQNNKHGIKGKESYRIGVYLGKDDDGKKCYQWETIKGGKKKAQERLQEILHQKNTGMLAIPKGTLGEFIERWLKEYAKTNLSPRTAEGYESIYHSRLKSELGLVMLKDLKPAHIQKYYADLQASGKTSSTARHHAMMLHRVLEHAVKWQLLPRNPADAVTPPKNRHIEMKTLDESQAELILNEAMNTPYYTLFALALHTGARRSELLSLRWQDISFPGAELSISRSMHRLLNGEFIYRNTKTVKSNRSVALSPMTCQMLRHHLDNEMAQCSQLKIPFTNERLVFCRWNGEPLIPHTVSQAWRRLARRLGIKDIHFHSLRHTMATLMLERGIHPKIVQERLGHSSIAITMDTYSHVMPGMQKKAAETLDTILRIKDCKKIAVSEISNIT